MVIVDDGSSDNTLNIAQKLRLTVIKHPKNLGYGASQKTLYNYALNHQADIVVLLHADNQYDPSRMKSLVAPIMKDKADFVFGSRFLKPYNPLEGGMPILRFLAIKFLTHLENVFLKTHFSELSSGLKAYSIDFLKNIDFNHYSHRFVFDLEMLFDAILKSFRIQEIPIPTRFNKETSSMNFKDAFLYISQTLIVLFKKIIKARSRN